MGRKRADTRRPSRVSLKKMVLLLLFLLVPVVMGGASILTYSFWNAYNDELARMRTNSLDQLHGAERNLLRINSYLLETLLRSNQIQEIQSTQNTHEKHVAARALLNDFEYQHNIWAHHYNFFILTPAAA